MNKKTFLVIILALIISLVIGCTKYDTDDIGKDSINDQPDIKLKAVDCVPEQRNVNACIEIYQPVCGQVQVECIKAPCNPIKETFENSCKACTNPRVISYTEGECSTNQNIT